MDIFIKAAIAIVLVLALLLGLREVDQRGYNRAMAEATAATNTLKVEAAATLASETAKARTAEQALQAIKNTQELHDADHQKTVADLSDRLRRLADPAGRLRDPHAAGCGGGSSSAPGTAATAPGDRADDAAQTGGLLSVPLTDLLAKALRESDEINVAYASCRTDAYAVRGQPLGDLKQMTR